MSERVNKLRAQRAVQHGLSKRSCGTCSACCTVLGVEEIDKPVDEPCKHLATKGCAIYATRPQSCRDYHCLWRAGVLDGEARPDRLGIVIDVSNDQPDLLFAREFRPGALIENRSVLNKLAQNAVVVFITPGGQARTAIGPPDKIGPYLERARRTLNVVE